MSRVDRHCIRALVLLVLLAVPLPVARAASGPFTDLPARERSLSDGTPQALSHAYGTAVHGDDAGHVAVLNLQDFTLRALYSADGGITFAPEVVVAGGPERPIRDFTSTAASDGTVAVELAIGDPEGNIGISVVVSHDAGRTWSAPVSVVKHGDPNMGVMARRDLMSISVGAGGRMALFFANEAYRMYRVATSVDGGATWGAPVRVDTVTGYPSAFTPSTALAVDGSGRVHVAWLQPSGSGTRVAWYARSTDAGASYSAPLNLSATAHPSSTRTAYWVTLAGTNDGALLAAIAESQVSVVRSIDGGATFTTTYNASQGTSVRRVAIATASAHSTVLVLTQDQTASPGTAGQVRAMRSTDQGATWGTPSVVAPAARLNAFAADAVGNAGWALAWTDTGDNVTRIPNATWASTSADDGATWSTAQRADDVPAAPGFTTLARNGLSRAGAARFVLAYTDGRAALNRSQEVRTNGSALTPVSFGPDASAPFARVAVNPYAATPSVATGPGGFVYVAFATATGPRMDLWVRTSTDGGRTFTPPLRIPDGQPGDLYFYYPRIDVGPDGTVYLVYGRAALGGTSELFVRRSTDHGATWSAPSASLGPCVLGYENEVQIAYGAGAVYLAWPDTASVNVARSTDGGLTFTKSIPSTSYYPYSPSLCANGARLVLGHMLFSDWDSDWMPVVQTSADGGQTWTVENWLMNYNETGVYYIHVACDGVNAALVAWPQSGKPQTSRWDGASWSTPVVLPTRPNTSWTEDVRPLFLSPDRALVQFASYVYLPVEDDDVEVAVSTDGGRSFPSALRLDDPAPLTSSGSAKPRLVADGNDVWALWLDPRAGADSVVTRHSPDAGTTWDPQYRVDRDTPQGARFNSVYSLTPAAAANGRAFFVTTGQRASSQPDVVLNVYDGADLDGDGAATASDCNDFDPTVLAAPAEVAGVRVTPLSGAAHVSWAPQPQAGSGTAFDLASGALSSLHAGFAGATCLANSIAGTSYDDGRSTPPAGDGTYALVRGRNACGTGTWGVAALDAASPCP